jgi:hypothetical protein
LIAAQTTTENSTMKNQEKEIKLKGNAMKRKT